MIVGTLKQKDTNCTVTNKCGVFGASPSRNYSPQCALYYGGNLLQHTTRLL